MTGFLKSFGLAVAFLTSGPLSDGLWDRPAEEPAVVYVVRPTPAAIPPDVRVTEIKNRKAKNAGRVTENSGGQTKK